MNLLTTTRVLRKGFKTHLILYGPGVLMASGTRGFPNVGDEAFPGHMAINKQLETFMARAGPCSPAGSRPARCTASRRTC